MKNSIEPRKIRKQIRRFSDTRRKP